MKHVYLLIVTILCLGCAVPDKRVLVQPYDYQALVSRMDDLTQRLVAVEAKTILKPVAFKAHLSQSVSPSANQLIVFDSVQLNLGSAYHAATGVFMAPVTGIYLFSLSLCSGDNHYIQLDLMRNTDVIGDVLAGDKAYTACSSETTIAELHAGDDVYVKHRESAGDLLYAPGVINSFTGALLQKL